MSDYGSIRFRFIICALRECACKVFLRFFTVYKLHLYCLGDLILIIYVIGQRELLTIPPRIHFSTFLPGYSLGLLRFGIIDLNLHDYQLKIWCLITELHVVPGKAL